MRMRNKLRPNPKSLGAGVDGGSYLKPRVLVEENSVKYIAFASSILSDNGDDSDMFIMVDFDP